MGEQALRSTFTYTAKSYSLLTKPGIILGNLITMAAGFMLAGAPFFDAKLFCATFLGLALVIASGCVFNNWIDKEADKKMVRTRNRPLASGAISPKNALIFAIFLGAAGLFLLYFLANSIAAILALFGLFVYTVLYSLSKYYSVHGTLIGSVAGAVPPIVGYVAVAGKLDTAALLFFLVMLFWQMPHFFAIALVQIKDYEAALIPVLPLKRGLERTKKEMLFYTVAYLIASWALGLFSPLGPLYFIAASFLGLYWLYIGLKGFWEKNEKVWARKMFFSSLWVILGVSFAIVLESLLSL